jgi:hypothetical protein
MISLRTLFYSPNIPAADPIRYVVKNNASPSARSEQLRVALGYLSAERLSGWIA